MSNSYFRFKQFTVHQDKTAMKVCTDSCLFGAWTAYYLSNHKKTKHVLDVGAGTGLLSLMLAQKINEISIDAVETETSAAEQARENCEQSSWKENIQVYNNRIQDFYPNRQYNAIISNPPFYEDDLQSIEITKNIAHHDVGLTLAELTTAVKRLLTDDGCFAVLLPYCRNEEFEQIANQRGLLLNKRTLVKATPAHAYFRSMCLFSKEKRVVVKDEIVIKDESNRYSSQFIHLLKDYYLYL